MAKLKWDLIEERSYEGGVSNGVLYVEGRSGVAWNGLVSVTEVKSDVEIVNTYFDGVKTGQYAKPQEFSTQIEAITYPEEFEQCVGYAEVSPGMLVDEQVRKSFAVSYKTLTGDYNNPYSKSSKIHLVYNGIATPSDYQYSSLTNEVELSNFVWDVTTTPEYAPGYRPTSHFILDDSRMGPMIYEHITDLLYGSPNNPPTLLTPNDIISIAGDWNVLYPSNTTYPSYDTIPLGP